MLGCRGKVQSANGTVHLIVEHLVDLSNRMKARYAFSSHARARDEAKHGGNGLDSREPKAPIKPPVEFDGGQWTIHIGDKALVDFTARFKDAPRADRHVLVNALGDGRLLAEAPTVSKAAG
jgi:hypothetical protein